MAKQKVTDMQAHKAERDQKRADRVLRRVQDHLVLKDGKVQPAPPGPSIFDV